MTKREKDRFKNILDLFYATIFNFDIISPDFEQCIKFIINLIIKQEQEIEQIKRDHFVGKCIYEDRAIKAEEEFEQEQMKRMDWNVVINTLESRLKVMEKVVEATKQHSHDTVDNVIGCKLCFALADLEKENKQ